MPIETCQDNAMEMARDIIAAFPETSALELGLAAAAVIAIITEETGRGALAVTIGRTLIEIGESANAQSGN